MLCDKRRGRQGEAVFVCYVINDADVCGPVNSNVQ